MTALALLAFACSKKDANPSTSTQATELAPQGPSGAPTGASLLGIDPCLVGNWKSAQAALNVTSVSASGGAGVQMKIEASGASSIDFTPMAMINATTNNSMKFDFRYSGKITGQLKTPNQGVVSASQTDYSGLKVSATINIPGGATMPLFKDTPVASLAGMAGSLAAGAKAAGQGSPSAPTRGIEASPVFSTDTYACTGPTLTLSNSVAHSQWTFHRVDR